MSHGLNHGTVLRMADLTLLASDQLWRDAHTLQIVLLKDLPSAKSAGRKRVALSDGEHYAQVLFGSRASALVADGTIAQYSIVTVREMAIHVVDDKRIVVVLEVEPIQHMDRKVGNPTAADGKRSREIEDDDGAALPAGASMSTTNSVLVAPPQLSRAPEHPTAPGQPPPAPHAATVNIKDLSPYQSKWTLKARVTNKSDVKTWAKSGSSGKVFSITLLDNSGEIRATGFNKVVDQLHNLFDVDGVYLISKARVILAKQKFSQVDNIYEIILEASTQVEKAPDDSDVRVQSYAFHSLASIQNLPPGASCDVLAVVKDVGNVEVITTKTAQKQMSKRDLTLVDSSDFAIRFTMWGQQAESFGGQGNPVIALKGVKVTDFAGRSLTLPGSGGMVLNPKTDEAAALAAWFRGHAASSFHTYQRSPGGSTAQGSAINRSELMLLQHVRASPSIGKDNGGGYFSCKATLMCIRVPTSGRQLSYTACPDCTRKVVPEGDKWRCGHCLKEHEAPSHRYSIDILFADNTGEIWATAFQEAGELVIGAPALEILQNPQRVPELLRWARGKTYLMSCRAKQEEWEGAARMRYTITRIQPVDYRVEAEELMKEIKAYPSVP